MNYLSTNHNTKSKSACKNAISAFLSALCFYIYVIAITLISLLPFRLLYLLSDAIFAPLYHVLRYRRKTVRRNLIESFPEKNLDEIVEIEKNFYHFFIDMMLESCKLMTISPEEIGKRMKFVNINVANTLLKQGCSVSLYLGHYCNWEWMSSMALWLDKDAVAAQIYHKLSNRTMDKVMKKMRGRLGATSVEMRQTIRFMTGSAREKQPCIIGFIADQSPKRREAKYFVNFLNHTVPVLTGSEKATKHFGYKALYANLTRVKRGYYECELTPLSDDSQLLPDFELTNRYFSRLESAITQHPELYLWTHNRFKYAMRPDNHVL